MDTVADLLGRLGEIEDRLAALPDDAFDERITLREEQREVRARLRSAGDALSSPSELAAIRSRIGDLERRIGAVRGNRLSASAGAATGYGGGIDPEHVHAINARLDEAGHVAALRAELQRLRVKLAALERAAAEPD